ncbi:hypothetical protein [Cohnella soli]|uniref:Uncharacterized protein n=1 Tax=Cohnella soli TaxID=425005 RepID=A0ABW0I296_9BACL
MVKKKWIWTSSAIGISSIVMLSTGLTALAGTSGYDDYKAALKSTKALSSVSAQASATLRDNGNVIAEALANVKADLKSESKSGNVKVTNNGGEQYVDLYALPDGQAWKSNATDTYFVKKDRPDSDSEDSGEGTDSSWIDRQAETVIDALVGNLKNEVTEEANSDGSKKISIALNSMQIPAVVQALAPIAFHKLSADRGERDHEKQDAKDSEERSDPEDLFAKQLFNSIDLTLTQDIQLKSIDLTADINASGQIERQQASIVFVGKDASGATHELNFSVDAKLSAFNQTTPDTIDLTGKKVQTVQDRHAGKHRD